jgi:hypothetical protein
LTGESSCLFFAFNQKSSPDQSVGNCGDRNADTLLNKVIDCEVSAIEDVQEALLQSGNVDLVGLAWFGSVGDRVDFLMKPWNQTEGKRDSTIVEYARQLTALGLTNYQAGVEQACELARKVENNNNKTVVIMVSVKKDVISVANKFILIPTSAAFKGV